MTKKFIFLIMVLFLFLSSVQAEKIIATQEAGAISIEYPKIESYIINEPIKLNFHAYNSTGHILDSDTICNVRIYNQEGKIIAQDLIYSNDDFVISLPTNISSEAGIYYYLVGCNNTNGAGFVSSSFEITRSLTFSLFGQTNKGLGLIVATLGFLFILAYVSFNLNEEHIALKVLLFAFVIFGLFILTSLFSVGNPEIRIMNLAKWVIGIFIAYILLYVIYYFFLKVFVDKLIKRRGK